MGPSQRQGDRDRRIILSTPQRRTGDRVSCVACVVVGAIRRLPPFAAADETGLMCVFVLENEVTPTFLNFKMRFSQRCRRRMGCCTETNFKICPCCWCRRRCRRRLRVGGRRWKANTAKGTVFFVSKVDLARRNGRYYFPGKRSTYVRRASSRGPRRSGWFYWST